VLGLFAKKATAVMTNVPGPAVPLKLCGSTLRQTMFWVPASGDIGVGVSILSYGGGVQFGLITDAGLCPEPQADHRPLRTRVRQAAVADDAALMLPWETPNDRHRRKKGTAWNSRSRARSTWRCPADEDGGGAGGAGRV
jgi:hypothetical protein